MNTIKIIVVVSMVLLAGDLVYHQVVNGQTYFDNNFDNDTFQKLDNGTKWEIFQCAQKNAPMPDTITIEIDGKKTNASLPTFKEWAQQANQEWINCMEIYTK